MDIQYQIESVKEKLKKADAVTFLTGSGLSADSGIPTFRGKEGLWREYKAEDLATPTAFSNNPRLVWEWYDWRRKLIASKEPNAGHFMIAEMEKHFTRFHLITQNIDGFHEKAGSTSPIEIHGNIWKVRCMQCFLVSFNFDIPIHILPTCKECGGLLRPHVVWFGEQLDDNDMEKSYSAVQHCDIMFVVGTSGVVQPAASFASIARRAGAYVVEINIEKTPTSEIMDISLIGRASEILPLLI